MLRQIFGSKYLLLIIILFGFFYRLAFLLTNQTLYGDEFVLLEISKLPALQIISGDYWNIQFHPFLLYLVTKIWSLVSIDEIWIRLPSFAASIASIPIIYLIGRKLLKNKNAALLSAFIFAFSTYNVRFASEAKYYMLLLLFELLTVLFFLRKKYFLFIVFSFLAFITDYSFIWLFIVYWAVVLFFLAKKGSSQKSYVYLLYCLLIVVLLFSPWAFKFLFSIEGGDIPARLWHLQKPDLSSVGQILLSFISYYGNINDITKSFLDTLKGPTLEIYVFLNYSLLGLLGYIIYSKRSKNIEYLVLALMLILPISISFLISQFLPIFIGYNFMIVQIPIIFYFAKFISERGKQRIILLFVLLILNLLTLLNLIKTGFPKYYFPEMYTYLNKEIKSPAVLFVSPEHTEYVLNYIDRKNGSKGYKFKISIINNKQVSPSPLSLDDFRSVCFFLRPARENKNVLGKIIENLKSMHYSTYIDRWVGAYYLNCYEK